jgi:hypothetical protein
MHTIMPNNDKVLTQARALYDLGFAIHWLRPKSKKPIKDKWSGPIRDEWDDLVKNYYNGLNVGVRLGHASKIGGYYLAGIDLDIKSSDPLDRKEAEDWIKNRYPELFKNSVRDFSGRGNGSGHIFVLVKEPFKSRRVAGSSKKIKVLVDGEIVERQAWEIEFMSEGKQIALPPSIHPDTGIEYFWDKIPEKFSDFSIFEAEIPEGKSRPGRPIKNDFQDFKLVEVDLIGSALGTDIVDLIISGKDSCGDGSTDVFKACKEMVRERFSNDEIMSVFTDKNYYLGGVAYRHRNDKNPESVSRASAAQWIYKYCIIKAREQADAKQAFDSEIEITKPLSETEAENQSKDIVRVEFRRNKNFTLNEGLWNTVLALKKVTLEGTYGCNALDKENYQLKPTPWNKGENFRLTDIDYVEIKFWISNNFNFEPGTGTVREAVSKLSADNTFDPLQIYLDGLAPWDGIKRLENWLTREFKAKEPKFYVGEVFTKWICGAVARAYEPGYKFDWMIVFESSDIKNAQGKGKSAFGSYLFTDQYFLPGVGNIDAKDAMENLIGKWGVEFGELKDLTIKDIDSIKHYLSKTKDSFRPAYGRSSLDYKRRCVFYGTTNDKTYLKDVTGNRRFCPVSVDKISDFAIITRDRDLLFAEAVHYYKNKTLNFNRGLELEGAALDFVENLRAEKMIETDIDLMRYEIVNDYLLQKNKPGASPSGIDYNCFKMNQLFDQMGPLKDWKSDAWKQRQAATALYQLGATNRRSAIGPVWKLENLIIEN